MLDLLRSLPRSMVFFIVVLFTQAPMCFANAKPLLSRQELAAELEDIERLTDLLPFEQQTPDLLKQRLLEDNYTLIEDKRSVFGLEKVRFEKQGQHKTIYLNFSFFNSIHLCEYWVSVATRYDDLTLKAQAIWRQKGGEESTGHKARFNVHVESSDDYDRYYQAVINGNGALLPVQAPDNLTKAYDYLISDINDSIVEPTCYVKASWFWLDQCAIDQLVAADRIDLLENVLNGFNPGARILAAIKLTRLGVATRPDIQKTINKLMQLNTPIKVRNGRIGLRIKSPRSIRALIKTGDVDAVIADYFKGVAR